MSEKLTWRRAYSKIETPNPQIVNNCSVVNVALGNRSIDLLGQHDTSQCGPVCVITTLRLLNKSNIPTYSFAA
jgi:hypothetical protein